MGMPLAGVSRRVAGLLPVRGEAGAGTEERLAGEVAEVAKGAMRPEPRPAPGRGRVLVLALARPQVPPHAGGAQRGDPRGAPEARTVGA